MPENRRPKTPAKIRISSVCPETSSTTGLFESGCWGCACDDECCELGCDVDLVSLKLIEKHKALIEPLIGARLEDSFSTRLIKDDDYIGGAYRSTKVRRSDTRCAFHLKDGRGCALFKVWKEHALPKRIIPTICRIYPLTWHRGELFVDSPIRRLCKIRELPADGSKPPSLMDTQGRDLKALFEFRGREIKGRGITERKIKGPGNKKRQGKG